MAKKRSRDHLEALRAHAAATRRYLTDGFKPERERDVCRAFLRCAGISFAEEEIVAPAIQPADVAFREARFHIRELMETGRRRSDEWKRKHERWNRAQTMDDALSDSRPAPLPMPFAELMSLLTTALEPKAKKYGAQCRSLDALVYVNMTMTRVLDPASTAADTAVLEAQGWRSVAVVFPPWALVMIARPETSRLT